MDLSEAVKRHKEKGALASLITKRVSKDQVSSYGVVVTDEEDRVKAFQEKPSIDNALGDTINTCLLYTSPSPRDRTRSRMPSSA